MTGELSGTCYALGAIYVGQWRGVLCEMYMQSVRSTGNVCRVGGVLSVSSIVASVIGYCIRADEHFRMI